MTPEQAEELHKARMQVHKESPSKWEQFFMVAMQGILANMASNFIEEADKSGKQEKAVLVPVELAAAFAHAMLAKTAHRYNPDMTLEMVQSYNGSSTSEFGTNEQVQS